MRSRFVLVLGIAGALVTGACSTAESSKVESNSPANAGASNSVVAGAPTNSNTQVLSNGEVLVPHAVDANAVASAQGGSVTPPVQDRLEKMRSAGTSGERTDAAALAMKNARPAPDNSTFATYLTDAGYEIRTFTNNPIILKAEKKIENNGNQSLKIFLRNGNVVELPGKAVSSLSTASADAIATAAGVTTAPSKPAATGSTGAKKAGN
ncbi:MAG TPA: hypothetical protein VMZ26_12510 [Pyrinomonadaceae bacterium]|nr:hypothetical protein [Pyrinomonadaceae bacterium]